MSGSIGAVSKHFSVCTQILKLLSDIPTKAHVWRGIINVEHIRRIRALNSEEDSSQLQLSHKISQLVITRSLISTEPCVFNGRYCRCRCVPVLQK